MTDVADCPEGQLFFLTELKAGHKRERAKMRFIWQEEVMMALALNTGTVRQRAGVTIISLYQPSIVGNICIF